MSVWRTFSLSWERTMTHSGCPFPIKPLQLEPKADPPTVTQLWSSLGDI